MKSNAQIVTCDQLRDLMGQNADGHVANCLRKEGIPFFQGKAGPWTTLELLTIAGKRKLGLSVDDKELEQGVM